VHSCNARYFFTTSRALPGTGTSPGTVVCAGLPVPGSVATMLRHNRIINLPVAFCCGDAQHACLRQASDTPLPLSGGKMLFLGASQMLLAVFYFCSVLLMIVFIFLLFLQPTTCCLPAANNNAGNDVNATGLFFQIVDW